MIGWRQIVFCFCILTTQLARGVTVNLSPSQDATLYEDPLGQIANGAGSELFAGRVNTTSAGKLRRALVQFNLSGIPSGSTVTSASLVMTSTLQGNPPTFTSLHRVLASWGEGASQAPANEGGGTAAAANDATWTSRFFGTALNWINAGGDFASAATTTATVLALGQVNWSGGTMVSDVQAWVTNPTSNFGWLLRGDESVLNTTMRYDSRQNATVAVRPVLTVIYTPPADVQNWVEY